MHFMNLFILRWPSNMGLHIFRVGLTLAHSLNYQDFPYDIHHLPLDISSCECMSCDPAHLNAFPKIITDAHDEEDIVYRWRDEHPVQAKPVAVQDPNFKLIEVVTQRCVTGTSLGEHFA